jgi:hypothetical protein
MCMTCGCMLPAQDHHDERTITYKEYMAGDRTFADAAKYNKGTITQAKEFTRKTLAAIESGKLSPVKRK